MNSALNLTIATLKLGAGVTSICGNRIYPFYAPQNASYPNIIIGVVSQDEEDLLQGASQWPEARVSIECRSDADAASDRLAEAVISWLRDKRHYSVGGCLVTFMKEGTDVTDASEQNTEGAPYFTRRIVDFYVRFRTESP